MARSRLASAARLVALIACAALLCGMLYWVGWLARGLFSHGLWLEFAGVCLGIAAALGAAYRSMPRGLRLPATLLFAAAFLGSFLS